MTAVATAQMQRAPAASARGWLQRKCACGSGAGLSGQCTDCERKKTMGLQARLAVGATHDPLEQEADRVADQVLANTTPTAAGATAPRIQRLAQPSEASPLAAPASVDATLAGAGQALEPALRRDMESRFGHDFSRVRVHADALAERSTRELRASAYTVGKHIVFGAGAYAPDTNVGRHLLAHELTHVVQQTGGGPATGLVQRGGKLKGGPDSKPRPNSCSGWTCGTFADCDKPDGKSAANTTASTSWTLTANLDLDVPTAAQVTSMDEVGHAFVAFDESNGDRYTYGHYPGRMGLPSDWKPEIAGCTVHPDTTHASCVDMQVHYSLNAAEYRKALDFAQMWCKGTPAYHLFDNNCTTFVEFVVKAAGKSIPNSRGKVAGGVKDADNPNTLFDAHLSQADNAIWRNRVKGDFTGQYDAAGHVVPFKMFKLTTNDKLSVAGDYQYEGSSGDIVEGSVHGRLIFDVDAASKAVTATVRFDWTEPGGSGKGVWKVDSSGDIKGSWGRGSADSGAGGWELTKNP